MSYDLITVGRANMDLYSLDVGAPFEKVRRFEAMVGGSPTNIAIATARLGLRSVAFTGVGDDRVGDFVLDYLAAEDVVTDWVRRIPGKLTSLALLGVEPPDHFPLSFYRDDPADIHLTVDHAGALPFDETAAVLISGNALSRGTCAVAARYCAERAAAAGLTVYVDLDLRPTEWAQPGDYGEAFRDVMPFVDVVIGTEEELWAALAGAPDAVMAGEALANDDHDALDALIDDAVAGPEGPGVVVLKRGPRGVTLIGAEAGPRDVAGFPVDVVNTVGAGDAFAGGLIARRSRGDGWREAASFANACGAIEVTRHGCAAAFPRHDEVVAFMERQRGGG